MQTEENSISIINKTNGQLTGEKAQALPIRIMANFSWMKIFLAGCAVTAIVFIILVSTSLSQVVAVEVSGKADNFDVLKLKS